MPKIVRPARDDVVLDDLDLRLVEVLRREGRLPNNALAERVGVAPSTCLTRTRSLVERGVISGFHAEVAPGWVGRPIEAMIAVRVRSDARASMSGFFDDLAAMDPVLNVYYLAGADDFHLHVAVESTEALRELVTEALSTRPEVARTETNLIFAHRRGDSRRGQAQAERRTKARISTSSPMEKP